MNQDLELWEIYKKQTNFQVPKTRNIKKLLQSLAIAEYVSQIEGLNNDEESFYLEIRDKIKKITDDYTPLVISILIIYVIVLSIVSTNFAHLSIGALGWSLYICFLAAFPIAVISVIINNMVKRLRIKLIPQYSVYQQLQNKILDYKKDQYKFWHSLTGIPFEIEVAKYFQEQGYEANLTKTTGDEGIDINLFKDSKRIIVQCKAHKGTIGVQVARDLLGTLQHSKANGAILVSLNGFSKNVYEFVEDKPIMLLTADDILKNR